MADGDLASIFRHHQQYQQHTVPEPQWGTAMAMPMAMPLSQPQPHQLQQQQLQQQNHGMAPHSSSLSQDSDVRWDYPNSLSPQSPFEYVDHQFQRAMQQSKSYSSLRPSSLSSEHTSHGQFPTMSRKRDYQGSNFQLRGKVSPVAPAGSSYSSDVNRGEGSENLGSNFAVAGGNGGGHGGSHGGSHGGGHGGGLAGVSSSWTSAPDCKVDELAIELESEILGDLRPGPGYLADHYPGRLLDPAMAGTAAMAMPGQVAGGVGAGSDDGTMIKVLNTTASCVKGGLHETTKNSATGLQLVHLLLACAEAVANEQMDLAQVVLARLSAMLVPCTTTMQRLGAVFVDALHARITRTATSGRYKGLENNSDVAILDMLQSFSVIYEFTPFIKLPHLTLNQIILDAVEGEAHVHVIDLNTAWRGMQWPAFIQALALRQGGPPKLRITSIGRIEDLDHAREKLQEYARSSQVPFEYCPIVVELRAFDVRMLDMREWEVVCINAVNQFHTLLAWDSDFFHRFLCSLRSLQPRVLAFTENDADHNSPTFLHRFFECLRYYSAVFDALDASLPPGSPALQQVEHLFTGQKIRNIVACEGEDRITRHENLGNWSRRLERAGFRATPISTRAISQARLLLHLYFSQSGYTLRTENGAVVLGWDNMSLLGATAWRA